MLNELSLVVDSLDRMGTLVSSRHPRINPMGKNRNLFVVSLGENGVPSRIEVLAGETAATLYRVEHGSAGSSFPGFNIPTPLRTLDRNFGSRLIEAIEHLLSLGRDRRASTNELGTAIRELFALSKPREFGRKQESQMQRSCFDLVKELDATLQNSPPELANFMGLLRTILDSKIIQVTYKRNQILKHGAKRLARLLIAQDGEESRQTLLAFQDVLFGGLKPKVRNLRVGDADYWKEKEKQDNSSKQPIYLDLSLPDRRFPRVAHLGTSTLVNAALLKVLPGKVETDTGCGFPTEDAFGEIAALQEKYPVGPKVAELGNIKLFSVNTDEVKALQRYGLKGSQSFPVSSTLVQRMSDALLYVANEENEA